MVTGGVLAVGSAVAGGLALSAKSDLESGCPERSTCDPSLRSSRDRAENGALAADIMWPLAVASFGVGLIWLLVQPDGSEDTEASIGCDGNGCSAHARFRF